MRLAQSRPRATTGVNSVPSRWQTHNPRSHFPGVRPAILLKQVKYMDQSAAPRKKYCANSARIALSGDPIPGSETAKPLIVTPGRAWASGAVTRTPSISRNRTSRANARYRRPKPASSIGKRDWGRGPSKRLPEDNCIISAPEEGLEFHSKYEPFYIKKRGENPLNS